MGTFKKLLLFLCGLVLVINTYTFAVLWTRKQIKCRNCNVILISVDTLASEHLPCYGYEKNTAPNLCKFAKENTYFENSYSQSHWTLPSHFSMFTGLIPSHHGVILAYKDSLPKDKKTITEIMKENGYSTNYFGPIVDGSMPLNKGLGRGFEYANQQYAYKTIDEWFKAIPLIENNKKPSFTFLHTYAVHDPYLPGKKSEYQFVKPNNTLPLTDEDFHTITPEFIKFVIDSFQGRIANSESEESLKRNKEILYNLTLDSKFENQKKYIESMPRFETDSYFVDWYFKKIETLNDPKYVASIYDEGIYNFDKSFGEFLEKFKNSPISKNTILIVTADHGESFQEHGTYRHCTNPTKSCLYNETIKVPLIIYIPKQKSNFIKQLVQTVDIMPTILAMTGVKSNSTFDGENLVPLINGDKKAINENKLVVSEEVSTHGFTIISKFNKLYVKNTNGLEWPDSFEYYKNTDLQEKNPQFGIMAIDEDAIYKKMLEYLLEYNHKIKSIGNFPLWLDKIKQKKLIEEGYF